MEEDDFERLIIICEKFKLGVLGYLSSAFIIYYYHFFVRKCGHFPREAGFCEYDKENEYFDENENIDFEFSAEYNSLHEIMIVQKHVLKEICSMEGCLQSLAGRA